MCRTNWKNRAAEIGRLDKVSWAIILRYYEQRDSSTQEEIMAYIIAQPCVDIKETACVEVCPTEAITLE